MDNKIFLVCLPFFGVAMVHVQYFLHVPTYGIQFLDTEINPTAIVIFSNSEGEWSADGIGVTALSLQLGSLLEQALIGR